MQPDPRYFGERGVRPAPPQSSGRWYLIPILLVGGAGLGMCCCGGTVIGYMIFGIQTTSDPAQVRAGLDGMTDIQLPAGLQPSSKMLQITGVEDVLCQSRTGRSFLSLKTGERFQLQHEGTLRDARDRGKIAAGGRPESPVERRTIKATVRGQRAEFIYKRYTEFETVSGYFQGKKYPVHLEGELSLDEFPSGTAATLVESIR